MRCLILHVDCEYDDAGAARQMTVRFTANGLQRLSALMWSKQLGVPRIQTQITPCTQGVEQAMDECRAQLDLDFESQEHFGCVSKEHRAQQQAGSHHKRKGAAAPVSAPVTSTQQQQVTTREEPAEHALPTFMEQLHSLSLHQQQQQRSEEQAQAPLMVNPDDPPQPLLFATLYDYLMTKRHEPSMGPPSPEFAWQRLHGWAREWYMAHKVPAGNDTHMATVCRVMRDHPESTAGWVRLVERKEAERESDKQILTSVRPLRPPHLRLVKYLLEQRFNPPGVKYFLRDMMPAEAWEAMKSWAAEWCLDHPEEGLEEKDMHNSVIEAMYLHRDGHRKWCAHACKQNAWPPPAKKSRVREEETEEVVVEA